MNQSFANPNPDRIFEDNPAMLSAVTPYTYSFQHFQYKTFSLADTNPVPLMAQDQAVELIIIACRAANAGIVNVWGPNIASAIGIPLVAQDVFVLAVDNHVWEFAEVMSYFLQKQNPYSRRGLNPAQWNLIASAATQNVDVCFAYGPPTITG